ncbi:acyltransferase [Vibrio sinaloensis]|uniref:acyltransferase n=1 Tax=Photobacterium sp. (strain ATCC 43367) TaxID=379097 RepID=UPI002060B135|nr:acyltransferase [Vibrio sinaloensis]UPQ88113.1 acyltransferase [Vibrio sinaloensis]
MKSFLNSILRWFVKVTYRAVTGMARQYDIKVQPRLQAHGKHKIILASPELAKDQIPASVYFNTASGDIIVGSNTVFGEDVKLLTGKHLSRLEALEQGKSLHDVPNDGRSIVIGKDCYIGSSAVIIGPVQIGDGAVVGAGSIVTKNIEGDCFYAGNPARKIKSLVKDEQ